MKALVDEVCKEFSVSEDALFQRSHSNKRAAARAHFCHRVHYRERLPYAVIARFLRITLSPMINHARRIERETNPVRCNYRIYPCLFDYR
ncbi:MAG: hypothetical protein GF363_16695 [Chitinivibrionales bacterium]|nr:hypothetical protein [Chitinivibrionales bacterium]